MFKTLTKLDETNVTVTEHPTLNATKVTIRYRNNPNFTEDKIFQELKNADVTELYRVKRKTNSGHENTNIYISTFDKCVLPKEVYIGWTKCEV